MFYHVEHKRALEAQNQVLMAELMKQNNNQNQAQQQSHQQTQPQVQESGKTLTRTEVKQNACEKKQMNLLKI